MNYLKINLSKLLDKVSIEHGLSLESAFVLISKGSNGFLWDLYDYVERKYGIHRDYRDYSIPLFVNVDGFLNELYKLTDADVDILTSGLNEHTYFEFMLYYSVEDLDL